MYLPYLQPPLTDEIIAVAQERLSVRLPAAYIAALRVQNGGAVRLRSHPSGHAEVDCIAGLGPRSPSLFERDWTGVKEYMVQSGSHRPAKIDELFPFCGDGHYYYCLDYRRSGRKGEPCVTYIDVESLDIDEVVAPDFATFLHQLRPPKQGTVYGLVTHDDPDSVAAVLSDAIGIKFEDRGDQANGYRVFSAPLADAISAWLTANRVRRGFVRRDHAEYESLSKLLPEVVDRHPEHTDCGFFLICTNFQSAQGKRIAARLTSLPFAVRVVRLDDV